MQENNEEEVTSIEEYVPFGFHIVESNDPEHGEFRVKNGTISMYDSNEEQYIPVAPNWDGAQDIWGTSKNYEEVEASGHDWISSVTNIKRDKTYRKKKNEQPQQREEFFPQDAWQITDGWTEAHAIGLPGVMVFEKDWIVKAHNRVCDSCFIYTPKANHECENCGSKMKELVA